jgi:hypothetical protein
LLLYGENNANDSKENRTDGELELVELPSYNIPYILEYNLHPNLICTQFLVISLKENS